MTNVDQLSNQITKSQTYHNKILIQLAQMIVFGDIFSCHGSQKFQAMRQWIYKLAKNYLKLIIKL